MYRYSLSFESVSGDSHDITVLHSDKMNKQELFDKLHTIAIDLHLPDISLLSYPPASEFRMFLDELLKHGFIYEKPEVEVGISLEEIAMGQLF